MDLLFSNSTVELLSAAEVELRITNVASSLERELMAMHADLRLPLLRYAISFGLPVQDSEDVVQETFLALFRHLQRGRSRENLRSWVFRVTHNLALKRRVRRKDETWVEEERHNLVFDLTPGPEDILLFQERQERLQRVMRALPENHQACLRLRAEGLRYREIAEVLGEPANTVKSRHRRALAALKAIIAPNNYT